MIKIGVMGAGYWGAKHIRNFHEIRDAELTVVCDRSMERLAVVGASYPGVRTTQSFEELIDSDVDGVVIATPPQSHAPLAARAIAAGKHVLVEKPAATSVQELAELVEAARRAGVAFMAGHTYEFHGAVEFLREYVASGELGELFYVDSARLNLGLFQSDVDVMWDLAPHDISMINYILGEEPECVSARGTAHINPMRLEVAHLEMLYSRNVTAHIHVSWLDPCKVRRLTLVGSRKMAVFDDVSESDRVRIYDKGVVPTSSDGGLSDFSYPPVTYRYGDVYVPYIAMKEPLNVECRHFVDCIATGTVPRSGAESAMRVVRVLERASASAQDGGARQLVAAPPNRNGVLMKHYA
ncbi:MAG: Gfo/Idh/MocA family oxidoreductase [Dehalococcoidia bacterium]